ncbi:MAG: hypothetical protein AAGI25_15990 [Bacteroidota bacterium]
MTICKYRSDYYFEKLPGSEDIEVVIEVADSTYYKYKEIKGILYASKYIPVY